MLFLWGDMMKVKLGDIGAILTGNTPKTSDGKNYISKDINFIKPSDIDEDKITNISTSDYFISELAKNDARILPVGSILVTCIGIIGKVGINSIECAFNQQINAIIPDTRKCNNKFLAYAIQFKKNELQQLANAPVVPILNKTQFSNIQICLPLIEKQNKIVAILDMINEIINKRQQQLKKLDELVKSRFIEMFGEPDKNTFNWSKEKLGEHLDVVNGFAFNSEGFTDIGIPVLRIGNINSGTFKATNMVFWPNDATLFRYKIYPGDLVISLTGTVGKDDYGNVCILGTEYKEYYLNQRNAKLDIKNTINKYYLSQILKFNEIKNQLTGISRGVRQANISIKDILSLSVPIPPIELQDKFADFVKQTDKSKLEIKKSLDKLEILKKSLMQEYFS